MARKTKTIDRKVAHDSRSRLYEKRKPRVSTRMCRPKETHDTCVDQKKPKPRVSTKNDQSTGSSKSIKSDSKSPKRVRGSGESKNCATHSNTSFAGASSKDNKSQESARGRHISQNLVSYSKYSSSGALQSNIPSPYRPDDEIKESFRDISDQPARKVTYSECLLKSKSVPNLAHSPHQAAADTTPQHVQELELEQDVQLRGFTNEVLDSYRSSSLMSSCCVTDETSTRPTTKSTGVTTATRTPRRPRTGSAKVPSLNPLTAHDDAIVHDDATHDDAIVHDWCHEQLSTEYTRQESLVRSIKKLLRKSRQKIPRATKKRRNTLRTPFRRSDEKLPDLRLSRSMCAWKHRYKQKMRGSGGKRPIQKAKRSKDRSRKGTIGDERVFVHNGSMPLLQRPPHMACKGNVHRTMKH